MISGRDAGRIVINLIAPGIEDRRRPGHDVDAVLLRRSAEELDVERDGAGKIDDLLAHRPAHVAEGE